MDLSLQARDDFGLKPLRPPAEEELHDLTAERYEQATTIVTSNLDFLERDQGLPRNRSLASATVDRLCDHVLALCWTVLPTAIRKSRRRRHAQHLPTPAKPHTLDPSGYWLRYADRHRLR